MKIKKTLQTITAISTLLISVTSLQGQAYGEIHGKVFDEHGVPLPTAAVQVIAGENVSFNPLSIPSVIYTNPEVAWCGDTENELNEQSIDQIVILKGWISKVRDLGSVVFADLRDPSVVDALAIIFDPSQVET